MAFISSFRRVLGGSSASALQSRFTALRHNSTRTSPSLLINGLSRLITDEKLKEDFSPFGQVVGAKVAMDKSGRSKGFGFITYSSTEEAERAREGMDAKFLDGWVIFVDPWSGSMERKRKAKSQQEVLMGRCGCLHKLLGVYLIVMKRRAVQITVDSLSNDLC